MSSLRKLQILSLGVIANSAAAMALMYWTDAHAAACDLRYECTALQCHNPFWAQSACSANLPPACSMTTPLACYDGGAASCPYLVLCQDQ